MNNWMNEYTHEWRLRDITEHILSLVPDLLSDAIALARKILPFFPYKNIFTNSSSAGVSTNSLDKNFEWVMAVT